MVAPTTSAKLSELAKTRPRDAHGHFIKAGTDPQKTVDTKVTTESPLPTISNPPKLPTIPPKMPSPAPARVTRGTRDASATSSKDLDEPLVVINNPFHKLLHWLDDIRKKQTTTFDLKISVPLIALPIFLIVLGGALQYMFTLGKNSASDPQNSALQNPTPLPTTSALQTISKVGIIRGTYAVLADEVTPTAVPTNTPFPPTYTPTPSFPPTPTFTPTPTLMPPSRFVLVDKDDTIFFLITPANVSLSRYLNQRVLITGLYDASKETITIKKYGDIEVLP